MFLIETYGLAVAFSVLTMFCWGSWANTQKLTRAPFPVFYWGYVVGMVLMALVFGLTAGSMGSSGRPFLEDLAGASTASIVYALAGGVVFNLANLLIVAAIHWAGMAIAFPVGIGLALVLGVIINYMVNPAGNPLILGAGVSLITVAIVLSSLAYSAPDAATRKRGLSLALAGGTLMSFFFMLTGQAIVPDMAHPSPGQMEPYAALFVFSIGVFLSNFLWNHPALQRRLSAVTYSGAGVFKANHLPGILGGAIWCTGMLSSLLSSHAAGFALAYGLGQGATMVATFWGVFIWKELAHAPARSKRLIPFMFLFYLAGIVTIILSRQ